MLSTRECPTPFVIQNSCNALREQITGHCYRLKQPGTQLGQKAKFRDRLGMTWTVGNYMYVAVKVCYMKGNIAIQVYALHLEDLQKEKKVNT